MKTNHFIHLGLIILMASPLLAIEAPEDDAPPPPPLERGQNEAPAEAAPEVPAVAAAFLGIVCSDMPEVLSTHLQLENGEGIVVRAVLPESPAAKAGIRVHDVITRIADEKIRTQEDPSRIVSKHKAGDSIRIDFIQKGEKQQLDIVLGERPQNLMAQGDLAGGLNDMFFDGLPAEQAGRIRDLIEKNLQPMDGANAPAMEDAIREMQDRMGRIFGGRLDQDQVPRQNGIHFQAAATIRLMDEQGSVEIQSSGDGKEVTVRDKQNEITWSGPWDTEQDKAAAPEEVRERVERLNFDPNFKGRGLRFNFRGKAIPVEPED